MRHAVAKHTRCQRETPGAPISSARAPAIISCAYLQLSWSGSRLPSSPASYLRVRSRAAREGTTTGTGRDGGDRGQLVAAWADALLEIGRAAQAACPEKREHGGREHPCAVSHAREGRVAVIGEVARRGGRCLRSAASRWGWLPTCGNADPLCSRRNYRPRVRIQRLGRALQSHLRQSKAVPIQMRSASLSSPEW